MHLTYSFYEGFFIYLSRRTSIAVSIRGVVSLQYWSPTPMKKAFNGTDVIIESIVLKSEPVST